MQKANPLAGWDVDALFALWRARFGKRRELDVMITAENTEDEEFMFWSRATQMLMLRGYLKRVLDQRTLGKYKIVYEVVDEHADE